MAETKSLVQPVGILPDDHESLPMNKRRWRYASKQRLPDVSIPAL